MSSAGRAASSSGCVARPRGHETGLTGYAESIQHSSPTGSSVMEAAEHREPYESRGSRTVLGAPSCGDCPLTGSEPAKKSGQNIPKNRCRTTKAERMVETRVELPFIGDQTVCLSHDQAARSGPARKRGQRRFEQ